jgi:hypothetical protein
MLNAIAIWAAVAALCGVAGIVVALRHRDEANFGGMSIAGRGLLWASAGGFITTMVQASNTALAEDALLPTLGLSGGLVLAGLVLYAVGQKSDGSAAWHREIEERTRGDVEAAASAAVDGPYWRPPSEP